MEKEFNLDGIELDFLASEEELKPKATEYYKVMIADDDEEVHLITKMILKEFRFEGKALEFIDTYSGKETIEALKENHDTAVLFLDVVMEETNSGLQVVEALRKKLDNRMTRIILRTGQPGEAPEETIIRDYDINDYRLKTEMTVKRLYTTLYSALRNYRDLNQINKHRKGLEKIIKTSANLFEHNSLTDFLTSILLQLSDFHKSSPEMVYIRDGNNSIKGGFVTLENNKTSTIVAATGKFTEFIGKNLETVNELKSITENIKESQELGTKIIVVDTGFIIRSNSKNNFNNYIYIEGNQDIYDFDLIHLFLTNYSVALDNYILSNMIFNTQKEIIITLGEVVEKHFEETSGHVKRISEMMYKFALHMNFSYSECEVLKIASTMHDVGKIAIPDNILKKPGKLTPDEFEVIKEHTLMGHKILGKSDLDILKIASKLALNHHEKFDGTGYPNALRGRSIPLDARMLSIIDVFDAMTHKRVYKDALSTEEALEYLVTQKEKHFDPKLVDVFIENIDDILDVE